MNTIKLNGELIISTINSQLKLINLNHLLDNTTIDLSSINKIDTAGIAMLIDVRAQLLKSCIDIEYVNIPINIQDLCKLYQITL